MELINYLLTFAKNNPLVSLLVAGVFLFVYTVVVLRKRRVLITTVESKLEVLNNSKQAISYSKYDGFIDRKTITTDMAKDLKTITHSHIHAMAIGLCATVLVYFWWVPMIILAVPIALAIVAVYPDRIKKLLSKTVKE